MADGSKIEWTEATWNPVTGCSVVSPGCTNCYAQRLAGTRLRDHPSRSGLTKESKAGPVWTGDVRFNKAWLPQPLGWARPRRIFVCAHGDLFHYGVPDEWIDAVFAVMEKCPQHTFQILTKRPERMHQYVSKRYRDAAPLPHVHLGVSVEDQARADERLPYLVMTPAAVRFISYEPALGPLDLRSIPMQGMFPNLPEFHRYDVLRGGTWTHQGFGFVNHSDMSGHLIHQVIFGGESGPGARPAHPDWARHMRDECEAAGAAFFFKQHGSWVEHTQLAEPANAWDRTSKDGASPTVGKLFRSKRGGIVPLLDGREVETAWPFGHPSPLMVRVGKADAGTLLDGKEYKEHPEDGAALQLKRLAAQRAA